MRRSLYSAEDIADVATRKARGRKPETIAASSMDWGEPTIATSLSTVHRGKLYYRGIDAIELACSATLEDTAVLLWDCDTARTFSAIKANYKNAYQALSDIAPYSSSILGQGVASLADEAQSLIRHLTLVCGAEEGDRPAHERLASGWQAGPDAGSKIGQALIAMADHDLNASTFASRVAASTGASLPACLLSGLCVLSGPRHGGAAQALNVLLDDTKKLGAAEAISRWLARDNMIPGFATISTRTATQGPNCSWKDWCLPRLCKSWLIGFSILQAFSPIAILALR